MEFFGLSIEKPNKGKMKLVVFAKPELLRSSSSTRSISIAQLHALLRFHLRPIKQVVYL